MKSPREVAHAAADAVGSCKSTAVHSKACDVALAAVESRDAEWRQPVPNAPAFTPPDDWCLTCNGTGRVQVDIDKLKQPIMGPCSACRGWGRRL